MRPTIRAPGQLHRWLPFSLIALFGSILLSSYFNGCNHSTMQTFDAAASGDLSSSDLRASPDLDTTALLKSACTSLCMCVVMSNSAPDVATCTAGCTGMNQASYYPASVFGSRMPSANCLECLAAASCPELQTGKCHSSCF